MFGCSGLDSEAMSKLREIVKRLAAWKPQLVALMRLMEAEKDAVAVSEAKDDEKIADSGVDMNPSNKGKGKNKNKKKRKGGGRKK